MKKEILDTFKPEEIRKLKEFEVMCENASHHALLDAFLQYHEEQRHRNTDLEFEAYMITRREIFKRMRHGKKSL
jgi:hypothetical protein